MKLNNNLKLAAAAVGIAGITLIAAGCTSNSRNHQLSPSQSGYYTSEISPDPDGSIDLLKGNWNYMIGTHPTGSGLDIVHTGAAVLNQELDGRPPANPTYQPNPPVNLYGTHLELSQSGEVSLSAKMTKINGKASIAFLSQPRIRRDESIGYLPEVDITINNDTAEIDTWNGEKAKPNSVQVIDLGKNTSSADIKFIQDGNNATVSVNGKSVTLHQKIIDNQVWFSFDSGKSWKLTQLTASPENGSQPIAVDSRQLFAGMTQSPDGLSSLVDKAGHKKLIGTAVDLAELMANPEYTKFIIQNFNEIETESLAKFQAIEPEQGKYQFAELDALVKFANEHGLTVHGHALAFTEAYPQWLNDKLNDPKTTPQEAQNILMSYITAIVTRYDGHNGHGLINNWDVLNEPFDPNNWGAINKQSIWYKSINARDPKLDYIAASLKAARLANPNAKLFLNDWAGETDPDRLAAMYDLSVKYHKMGLLDGVGFQSHFDEDTLNDDQAMNGIYSGHLEKIMQKFAQAGILVRLSEVSVALNIDKQTQADVYGMLARACIVSSNCVGFNMWGATNSDYRNAYMTGDFYNGDPGNDAPTTQNAKDLIIPRPAWASLRNAVNH